MTKRDAMNLPTATYRLQLTPGNGESARFGFEDAEKLIPYLKKLGISHLYLSPITTPVKGSTHGYSVIDYNTINPELGGEEGFRHLAEALHKEGMGVIVDFVPNHMGVEGGQNPWWQDVLKHGKASKYADYFDINWEKDTEGKLVVPFLGDDVEQLIDKDARVRHPKTGEYVDEADRTQEEHPAFRVIYDEGKKEYSFDYWGKDFPINEKGQETLKNSGKDIDAINQDTQLLQHVLDKQYYRPIHWSKGIDQLNHRRFFNINELAGVRVEDPAVFNDTHQGLKQWVDEGLIDGIRLDHIDGLRDPEKYLRDLRKLVGDKMYIVAEKILAPDEKLPEAWLRDNLLQGTTGYDATIPIGRFHTHPSDALIKAYGDFLETKDAPGYAEILRHSRIQSMKGELKPELDRLTGMLESISQERKVSFSKEALQEALQEFTAAFPTYRTYIVPGEQVSETDRELIRKTADKAEEKAESPEAKRAIGFIADVMQEPISSQSAGSFIQSFQQFTGPVIAKGTEDTAFYRYHELRGAAEVGAELDHLGMKPEEFTEFLQQRMASTMNAMSTHDTKLGEDTRARAITLSHIPEIWAEKTQQWKQDLQHLTQNSEVNGKTISLQDQYLFYQTLVATYPLELMFGEHRKSPARNRSSEYIKYPTLQQSDTNKDVDAEEKYLERMQAFMKKAICEAKENTAWVPVSNGESGLPNPNPDYEDAVASFVAEVLNDRKFIEKELRPFAEKIARMGANVSLSQRVLQATAPGVPDIYQGSEGWNLSTVDPDNRITPDYAKLDKQLTGAGNRSLEQLAESWPDGRVKQVLTQKLLHLREKNPEIFSSNEPGELVPLHVYGADGKESDAAYAFARIHDGKGVVVMVPRALDDELFKQDGHALGLKGERFAGLSVEIPEALKNTQFIDALRGEDSITVEQGRIRLSDAFKDVPAAVMGSGISL